MCKRITIFASDNSGATFPFLARKFHVRDMKRIAFRDDDQFFKKYVHSSHFRSFTTFVLKAMLFCMRST